MMLVGYVVIKYFKREKQHFYCFVVIYSYQSYLHIERMIFNWGEWGGEVTSFTMNLVCRIISLGYCFRDGSPKCKGDIRNDKALSHMPSFWQYVGYCFNAPSCIAGPFFEYQDYNDWIELKGPYANLPSTVHAGFRRFATAFCWVALGAAISMTYPVELLWTDYFCALTWYWKLWTLYMCMCSVKYIYYIIWAFNDSAVVVSGLGYKGVDTKTGAPDFSKIKNIDEWRVDLGHIFRNMAASWNISIMKWMKKYVHDRLVSYKQGNPTVFEYLLTFMISAFWHGFYPGYYFFFLFYGMWMFIHKEFRKHYSYLFRFIPKRIGRFLAGASVFYGSMYIVPAFACYEWRSLIKFYNCQYWYFHFFLVA